MRWHPDSGWGIVLLGNRTYTRASRVGAAVLSAVVERHRAEHPVDVAATLWPRTREAMTVVESLLDSWDDALADAWLAPNVDQDRPRADRRAALELVRSRIGTFTRAARPGSRRRPPRCAGGSTVPRARAGAEVLLSPDREPLIQSFTRLDRPGARDRTDGATCEPAAGAGDGSGWMGP